MENKNDKTQMYSDGDKTSIYGDKEKRTKESAHQIQAGDKVVLKNKKYTIIELVSESTGEAVIYKAEDNKKKIIALKLYYEFHDPEQEPNTEALERIKKINDPDILKLIDYGTGSNKFKEKYCFEILDFAYGYDLLYNEDLTKKYTPSFLEKDVIPQIFKGIIKLHKNKIYHCDLKPQNVFYLDPEQKEIVVGDYGSAKTFEYDAEKSSRKTTTVKGTDFYLPPEQARGFISEKNDYYSFGMILLHVFYPDEILSDDKKNLSRIKLKQIIERQFESKPIIEYDPRFKRINQLIEGLTLADFNLRWGEQEVKDWLDGKTVDVSYRREEIITDDDTYAERSLKFGRHTIQSIYDVRDYILKEKDWYANLIEDETNREEFTNWFLELYDGDRSKRSAFNRIVKDYSQDGIEFVGDAITRFFIPDHPVTVGVKLFKLGESNDIIKSTGEVFSHLLFDCWDGSRDEQIKRYVFNFEFALRYTKDDSGAQRMLKILYKVLSVKEVDDVDFEDYTVHAYKYINRASKDKIKEFLTDILASDVGIEAVSLDKDLKFRYHVLKTASSFFKEIGSNHTLSLKFKEVHQIQLSKVKAYTDLDDFINKIFSGLFDKFSKKHRLSDDTVQNSKEQIKEAFIKFFAGLYNKIETELNVFQNKYSINSFEIKDSQFQVDNGRIVPDKIDYNKIPEICNDLISYNEQFKKIEEIKTAVKKDNEFFRKSSQLQDILNEIETFSFTGNFNALDTIYNNIHHERSYKVSELTDLSNSSEHRSIPYRSIDGTEQINVEDSVGTIAISGNGEKIVVAAGFMYERLRVIDTERRRVIRTIDNLKFVPESLSVCNDGKFVACIGTHDKVALIYNLDTGKRDTVLSGRRDNYAKSAAFSPDNKYLAVSAYDYTVIKSYGSWKTIKVYDTRQPVCFHPLEDYMANQDYPNTIQLVNLHNDERSIISERHDNDIDEMCFSPGGTMIATHGGDHIVRIWNVRTAELIQSLRGHAQYSETYICFSPDGKVIASLMNSGDVRLWNPKTGQAILTLEGFDSVEGICFHPSGECIIIADRSNVIMIPLKNKRSFNKKMSFADYVTNRLKPTEKKKKKQSELKGNDIIPTEVIREEEDTEADNLEEPSTRALRRSVRREQRRSGRIRRRTILWIIIGVLWVLGSIFIVPIINFFQDPVSKIEKFWYNTVKSNTNYIINTTQRSGNDLVYVEGGSFMMGAKDGYNGKNPGHNVVVPGFYMGKYEVTNSQFCYFLNEYKSIKVKSGIYKGEDMLDEDYIDNPGIRKIKGMWNPLPGSENKPVVELTWYGANEYCRYFGGRLPTEAEWEFAARGGIHSAGFQFAGSDNIDDIAFTDDQNESMPVGQKQPNEAGLYDMTGNVWEWCEDTYDEDYYQISPLFDPCNERNMKTIYGRKGTKELTHNEWRYYRDGSTVDNITYKSIRGCSNDDPSYQTSIERRDYLEKFKTEDDLGFRICFNDTLNEEEKQFVVENKKRSNELEIEKENRRSLFRMIFIEGGEFNMGDGYYRSDNKSHNVTLTNYSISNREITNQQFCEFLNKYKSEKVKSGEYEGKAMFKLSKQAEISKVAGKWLPLKDYENHPVTNVNWYGANEFCKFFGGRLPTEAEWEYAARGGKRSRDYPYPGGGNLVELAWFSANGGSKTHQVATKKANRLNLYDMTGNVQEWCEDTYDYNYYRESPKMNPCNLENGTYKVVRGGSFSTTKKNVSMYKRTKQKPNTFSGNTGFRIVYK